MSQAAGPPVDQIQITDVPSPSPEEPANCPPPAACPPAVEKRKHKHAARRVRRSAGPPVENVIVVGPESQFVPVPTRPVFGTRYDPRSMDDMSPAALPIDVLPQVMPSSLPPSSPPSDDPPPKPASASTASKKQAAKNADLTSSLQILK